MTNEASKWHDNRTLERIKELEMKMKTIKELRKEKGLSQEKLAIKAGVCIASVRRLDNDVLGAKGLATTVRALERALK